MSETPPFADAPTNGAPTIAASRTSARRRILPVIVGVGLVLLIGFIIVGLFLAARPARDQVQGMVEAETFTVATKVPSRVERFLASEGDQVKAGQELALMSSPEVAAKEAQAPALIGNSRPSPTTARPMQAKWMGLREWIRARVRGPMNSMAIARPSGMVRRAM